MDLKTLDIIGTVNGGGDKFCLVANQDNFIAKGTEDYILNLRKSILDAHTLNYRIPEMWDRNWNVYLGPIWAPDSIEESDLVLWLKPENFILNTAEDRINSWTDASSNAITFGQDTGARLPYISANTGGTMNNFNSAQFNNAGTPDMLYTNTDKFNRIHAEGFAWYFVFDASPDSDTLEYLVCVGQNDANGTFNVHLTEASTLTTVTINTKGGGSDNANSYATSFNIGLNILSVGKKGGGNLSFCRLFSADKTISGSDTMSRIITNDSLDTTLGSAYSSGSTTGSGEYDDKIYEVICVQEKSGKDMALEHEKIEAYLAHKYLLTGSLDASNDYITNPPRASVTT